MHRFYVSAEESRGETLVLSPRESRHATQVLRMRPGDELVVLNGAGEECLGEISELRREQVVVRVVNRQMQARLPYRITLVQAVPKGKIMDSIVQKATELGVARVIPILTERTVPGFGPETADTKRDRWEATAIEAMKQCGSAWLPELEVPISAPDLLEKADALDLGLVGSLQTGAQHPRRCFDAFIEEQARLPREVTIWIGPEGDFTPGELERIIETGVKPITMGRNVLRSDTAAVYLISVVQYELSVRGRP